MIAKHEITVGKCYINEKKGMAREVVEEVDRHKVKFNTFDLATGQLVPKPFQICFKSQIANWADREATSDEIAMIHPYMPTDWFQSLPTSEVTLAKRELAKATMLETVAQNTIHKC